MHSDVKLLCATTCSMMYVCEIIYTRYTKSSNTLHYPLWVKTWFLDESTDIYGRNVYI